MQILLDQWGPRFDPLKMGSTQENWSLPIGYTWGRLHTRITMAVHRSLALKPHNSNLPCMSPALLELPPPQSPGESSQMSASVYSPIRRHSGFQIRRYSGFQPPSISPGQTNRILADFLCQVLWGFLFQIQDL